MNQEEKLNIIKDILLTDQREYAISIEKKLQILEDTIYKRDALSTKVDPIIDIKLKEFVKEIPEKLGPSIIEALKEEIKNSQDAVVEVLYPILGKMVKRFVQNEMQILSEKINGQLNKTFSFKRFFKRKNSKTNDFTEAEQIILKQAKPEVEQIILIEKGSGLVLAEYSKEKTTDEDMVAGMLTAIKSFIEDAFKKESQNLTYIQYEHYHIHLQDFSSYYIAVLVSGAYNSIYRNELENKLYTFANRHIKKDVMKNKNLLNTKIEDFFKE